DHSIRRGGSNGHAVLACETDHSVVIAASRAEHVGELLDAEVLPIVRAGWIIKIRQESIQVSLIANRQADHNLQSLVCIETLYEGYLTLHRYVSCVSCRQGAELAISRFDSTY